ncbi:MAG TPA: molybdopterin-dependent oxidoreductase [Blastocatellia bacterium]|nr:molybdopterin-dependent oxidoreductase [Blastocatellia bacterium]
MKRREFIKLTSVGATGATLLSACGHPENKLIPVFIPDNEYVPGLDYWKASVCAICSAGCGIVVRTRERKANKIEGNPLHPVNRGALCARGQAGLQVLYNPDRIRSPLKRTGERGSGQFAEISWDEAIRTLAEKLREIKAQGRAASVAFLIGNRASASRLAAEHLLSAYGSDALYTASGSGDLAASSYAMSYQSAGPPFFDIANATYLLSFGARFLETWLSPVMYSLAYGEFRRASGKARGKFIHVEPRMSLTAANADEWLPARPGSEELVAMAISQVIVREGLIKDAPVLASAASLDSYAPEKTAEQTDIPAEKIIRIAREFAAAERPLAIGGGAESMQAINHLNTMVGNLNKPGGVFLHEKTFLNPVETLRPDTTPAPKMLNEAALENGHVSALLIHEANPVYTAARLTDKIKAIPFIASFSSFMDETTQLADLILPDNSYLESWDLRVAPGLKDEAVFTLMQPVVKPEFDTRQTADVLIALSRELGDAARPIPFESSEQIVRRAAAELHKAGGSINAASDEEFWKAFVERGVWTGRLATESSADKTIAAPAIEQRNQETVNVNESEYPFTLLAYEHSMLGLGEQANLPLLQEMPDPMTSVMWGSWVEINPKAAAGLGIADGDLVEVATPHGSVRAPAVLYPAIRPDVIAMPFGQGHTSYGRYASARGANALSLINLGMALETVRAKIAKISGGAKLIRFGTDEWERMEKKQR